MTRLFTARRRLERRYETLSAQLERIEADRRRAAERLSADFAEQAVERENDEVLDRLAESITAELDQVSTALERLDNGRYGTCEHCGKPIGVARMRAVPHATACAACAAAAASRLHPVAV